MRCKIEHTMCKQCHEKDEIFFRNWYTFNRKNALKTKDCMVVLRHEYVTFQHTFDTSNSLYESQKAHVYDINILWFVGGCCSNGSTLNQWRLCVYLLVVFFRINKIRSNQQNSFIPWIAYIQQFFLFIRCHCFGSNVFASVHPTFQIQLEYYMKPGKNFMALFLVHVITVFFEKFLPLFSFSMIFFCNAFKIACAMSSFNFTTY